MLEFHDHVSQYVDDYVHGALTPADAAYLERHCEGCPVCQAALTEARRLQATLQSVPPCDAPERLIQRTVARVEHRERLRKMARRGFAWGLAAAALAAVVLGGLQLYYHNLTPTPYDLAVLGQARLFPGSPASVCIRLVNHATGAALANVPVTVELHGQGQVVQLAQFQTNDQGVGQPRFQVPDWADGKYELRVSARPDGQTEAITHPIQLQRSWKLMLSSDKPVYQPGQDIHLRALALRRPDLKPVAGQDAVFSITDPKGNIIFKRQGATSAYGISAADCPLATEVIEGPYQLACKVGDTESRRTVEVKKYVLPKFRIDVLDLESYYKPGQPLKGRVHAEYFFGGPVDGGKVEIELRGGPGSESHVLGRMSLRTNGSGDAAFQYNLPHNLVGREQNAGDGRAFLQVKVQDSAGQEERRTVSRIVTNQPLRIEVIPESGNLVPGVPNVVYLYAHHPDGWPAAQCHFVVTDRQNKTQFELKANDLGVASTVVTSQLQPLDHPGPGSERPGSRALAGSDDFRRPSRLPGPHR